MNHFVPDFDFDDDDGTANPSSSAFLPHRKSIMAGQDEFVELLWHNGQIVMQTHNARPAKRSPPVKFDADGEAVPQGRSGTGAGDLIGSSSSAAASQLFMQEDEMASWLHYPIDDAFDRDFGPDLLCPGGRGGAAQAERRQVGKKAVAVEAERPPVYAGWRGEGEGVGEVEGKGVVNFTHFARGKAKVETRESTVVDSSETPATAAAAGHSSVRVLKGGGGWGSTCEERDVGTCEGTVMSSPDASGTSAKRALKSLADNRKRKLRDGDESECRSEDAEYESMDEKKVTRKSSARRTRAAEVHNLSERRRRDRINEKMKALQELIPRCNKSDKASMLDEAIEYLKSLQLQVQMMSMGCSMAPMMFPGMHQYMSPMGMGMGMGMEMASGFSRTMLPFPPVMAGPALAGPSTTYMGPRLPMPRFHMPHIPPSDQARVQATNLPNPVLNSVSLQSPNLQQQSANLADPYHQYLGAHQMLEPPQNREEALHPNPQQGR